jgi:hypothetical protein
LGALMGFGVGLGLGTAYGAFRLSLPHLPVPLTGILLGAAAMAASDVPSIKLDVTNPAEWGTSGWFADIVPHLAYGLVTASVHESTAAASTWPVVRPRRRLRSRRGLITGR